ncbi:hypothetical protein BDD12DRAFT_844005, partial [Trichophaea hybrida]
MPRIKEYSLTPHSNLEEHFKKALQGLQDGTFTSIQKATIAYGLKKSILTHHKNGRQSRQQAHRNEQVFSPAAET